MATRTRTDAARRARRRRIAQHAAACDRFVRWPHGTAVFASDLPHYYDVNAVRCEDAPELTAEALAAAADELQATLAHRRVEVWDEGLGARVRPGFEALGWDVERLVWMRFDGEAVAAPAVRIETLDRAEVRALRAIWIGPDEPHVDALIDEQDSSGDRRPGELRTIGVRAGGGGAVVAFARVRTEPAAAELEELYVAEAHRGRGLGRALTQAAMAAAGARELWVVADDEDWPKGLYERLGFVAAWVQHSFTRLPR